MSGWPEDALRHTHGLTFETSGSSAHRSRTRAAEAPAPPAWPATARRPAGAGRPAPGARRPSSPRPDPDRRRPPEAPARLGEPASGRPTAPARRQFHRPRSLRSAGRARFTAGARIGTARRVRPRACAASSGSRRQCRRPAAGDGAARPPGTSRTALAGGYCRVCHSVAMLRSGLTTDPSWCLAGRLLLSPDPPS